MTERFDFAFAPAYRAAARIFGVTPETAQATVDEAHLTVRFGPWRLRTPLTNITSVSVTGPYNFLKTAGPARLALTDRGLTFATNGERGVLVSFGTKVRGIEPSGVVRHPELTVTLADVDRFCARISAELPAP